MFQEYLKLKFSLTPEYFFFTSESHGFATFTLC
jgi:hypothetical protein